MRTHSTWGPFPKLSRKLPRGLDSHAVLGVPWPLCTPLQSHGISSSEHACFHDQIPSPPFFKDTSPIA